jgi:hypothetical protein
MTSEEIYSKAAAESSEISYYWATVAKHKAQSCNVVSTCLFTFAANFLMTLLLILITLKR